MSLSSGQDGRSRAVFISVTVTFILASIFVALRLTSRFAIVHYHGWDDICILLGWIFAFGMSFALDFGASRGLGLNQVDISPTRDMPLLVTEYVTVILFNPALIAIKTSILLLYLGITRRAMLKFLRIGSYTTLAVVITGGVTLTFITAFQCNPVQAAYDLSIKNPSCISIEIIYLASAPLNLATDLAIFVLPIPALTALDLPLLQKTILVMTFMLGIFVTVVDLIRIYYAQLAAISLGALAEFKFTTNYSSPTRRVCHYYGPP